MRPITLTLLPPFNEAILISLLVSIFNLSFLTRSSEITHIDTPISIRIDNSISAILI